MRRRCTGFSLLEVIVALALLAGTGVALFDWIAQNLGQAGRLRDRQLSAQLSNDALALVQTVNPFTQPDGAMTVDGVTVSWRATDYLPVRAGQALAPGATGPWQLGLYKLQVQAKDAESGVAVQFEVLQVGTKRTAPGDGSLLSR